MENGSPFCERRGRKAGMAGRGRRIPRVVLLIESSRSSGRAFLRGVADYARHHGPWAFLWEPGGLEKAWPRLRGLPADGVILRDTEPVREIVGRGLPAVVFGHSQSEVAGLANVITDSEAIGRLGAEHLIERGFRGLGYCGFPDKPWSRLRCGSFRARAAAAGLRVWEFDAGGRRSGEQRRLANWLEGLPRPVGVMACNDDLGEQVIEACKVVGLRVPDEVAVLGADNDELVCELSDPPLSSVVIGFERAGYESARALHRMMRGRAARGVTIVVRASGVVARQSTDALAMDDAQMVKALRFIRRGGASAMRVDEVARASGLSRRVLEKRFRARLGRSVLAEIRRVRVDRIARMLAETNLTVSQIALELGFGGTEHVARYFRRELGMTPLAFRRRHGMR